MRVITVFAVLSAFAPVVAAETIEIGPEANLQEEVNKLMAGDELVLRKGEYVLPSRFSIQLMAFAGAQIVIRAKQSEVPKIIYPSAEQNVINVENSSHIVLRGLEVTGGSHGIRLANSSFITVEDCHIHHTGDVALSANFNGSTPYEGLAFRRNHIRDTDGSGAGIALGCSDGSCQVFNSRIEGNYIHHTDGPNVTQGVGIAIGEGSHNNTVSDNVIHDTKNHPCIIADSTKNGEPNVIERNFLWDCRDHAIQATADAVIRNNVILRATYDGIASQPHGTEVPSNLVITHNTVLSPNGSSVSVVMSNNNAERSIDTSIIAGPIVIANNALFAQRGYAIKAIQGQTMDLRVKGNVGSGVTSGIGSEGFDGSASIESDLKAASYSGGLPQDVFPTNDSRLIRTADPAYLADDDFNAIPREGELHVGAYRWQPGGNPCWKLALERKDVCVNP